MRTITLTLTTLMTLSLLACTQSPGYDDEQLVASAEEAISYTDGEAQTLGLERDVEVLSDDRLIDEARGIAEYATEHGCDVEGVLGGVYTETVDAPGGEIMGRWFNLDQTIGGDLTGIHDPGDDDDGGIFEGDWESSSGLVGTLAGDYYGTGDGDGYYLGTYEETDGDAAGLLGGLWFAFEDQDGGLFFGVWGHCGGGTEEVEPESYE